MKEKIVPTLSVVEFFKNEAIYNPFHEVIIIPDKMLG